MLNRAGETRLTSRTPANVLNIASGRKIAVNVIFGTLNCPKAAKAGTLNQLMIAKNIDDVPRRRQRQCITEYPSVGSRRLGALSNCENVDDGRSGGKNEPLDGI